ncbi:MxaK protein [Methylomonas sp. SURF-1]|uniref:MxaK protein n=1 Tax=Methylomonas aurea TaxID=2952224 RepID=A0ABT1UEL4_9GAMM|nr:MULTISPECIES: MxaK protein [Methylomonas]MCQ8180169.1 MxaK protein [Methylomonas sp. SURF-1]TPQ29053.1 MxaK protein [Methylomonas koyamae]
MLIRRIKHGFWWTALAAALAVALSQAWLWAGIAGQNRLIGQLLAGRDVAVEDFANADPALRLARAVYLRKAGRYDDALATLNLLLQQAPPALRAQARYNLGNLYLTQAQEKLKAGGVDSATPLVGLAKQAYREALAADPGFWDAKYNLEVAMRLLPEMDRINSGNQEDDGSQKSELWTSLPGFPRGLP